MPISLEQLSREIGDQRRKVSELNSSLQAKITSFDETQDQYKKLTAELDNLEGDPTDEQMKQLDELENTLKAARLENVKLSDTLRSEVSKLNDLESDLKMRQNSNELEDTLNSSVGRGFGGDGASLLGSAAGTSDRVGVLPATRDELEHDLGVCMQSMILSQIDHRPASQIALNFFGNERVSSAMVAGDHAHGGSFIPGSFATTYIELLAQRAVVRSMGIPTVPLGDGTLTIPKITDGIVGGYVGEEEDAGVETIDTGDVTLIAKEMAFLVPASEKFLRSASVQGARMIREEMVNAGARLEDKKFLRGPKSTAAPTGLRYLAAHVLPWSGVINYTNVTNFLALMELTLLESHVPMTNPWWVTSHRTIKYLEAQRDGNGNKVWPEIAEGRINRYPFKETTHIPTNLAGGSVGRSEIMLLDASEQMIGDVPRVGFDSSNSAAYKVNGTMIAPFQKRQMLMRLVMENDLQTRHAESIVVGTDIEWAV